MLRAFVSEGNEVLFLTPATRLRLLRVYSDQAIQLSSNAAHGFRLCADRLSGAPAPAANLVILSFPHPPHRCGHGQKSPFSKAPCRAVPGRWLALSDEIDLERLCSPGPYRSILHCEGMCERTLLVCIFPALSV